MDKSISFVEVGDWKGRGKWRGRWSGGGEDFINVIRVHGCHFLEIVMMNGRGDMRKMEDE